MTQTNKKNNCFFVDQKLLPYVISLMQWENPNLKVYYDHSCHEVLQQTFFSEEILIIFTNKANFKKYKKYASKKLILFKNMVFPTIKEQHIFHKIKKIYNMPHLKYPNHLNSKLKNINIFQEFLSYILSNGIYRNKNSNEKIFPPIKFYYTSAPNHSFKYKIWKSFLKTSNPYYSTWHFLCKKYIKDTMEKTN